MITIIAHSSKYMHVHIEDLAGFALVMIFVVCLLMLPKKGL